SGANCEPAGPVRRETGIHGLHRVCAARLFRARLAVVPSAVPIARLTRRDEMRNVLLVGIGGMVGSVFRYLLSGVAQDLSGSSRFPVGTLAVNLLGCFVIGGLSQLADGRGAFSESTRVFLFVGILGGFTTFSAFGNETINALRVGDTPVAVLNVAAQVVVGLACVWLGRIAAYLVWR